MLRNNMVLKIISLLIAIFLWVYVMGEVDPTATQTIRDIPVSLLNEDWLEDNELAIKGSRDFTVDIIVEGSRAELNRMDRSEITAEADLFGYAKGRNRVPVQVEVPSDLTLREITTPNINVTLEDLISKEEKITVTFSGETASGSEPGGIVSSPAEIEVRGGRSAVSSVEAVEARIRAAELSDELQTFTVTPIAVDKDGAQVSNVILSAETVEVQGMLYYTKTLKIQGKDIRLQELENGLEASVRTANVSAQVTGSKEAVDAVSAEDLRLSANLRRRGTGTYTVSLKVTGGEQLENIDLTPEKVEVEIRTSD